MRWKEKAVPARTVLAIAPSLSLSRTAISFSPGIAISLIGPIARRYLLARFAIKLAKFIKVIITKAVKRTTYGQDDTERIYELGTEK